MIVRTIKVMIFALIPVFTIQAQDRLEDAKALLEFAIAGQGDSIYIRSDEVIQQKITPQYMGSVFKMLEEQFGNHLSSGEWKTDCVQNSTVCHTDLQFEKMTLKFTVVFDDKGKVRGINFSPAQKQKQKDDYELTDNDKIKEEFIEVITGDYKLPGILSLPAGIENPPVVILVHGSGPHDRDETIGPNKPFRELALGLAERGIAVIRYDKRTLVYGAKSATDGKINHDEETVYDALSAMKVAKSHKQLTGSKIYIVGHSQGALFAPRMATLEPTLAGIVMLAGNARPLEDILIEQYEYLATFLNSGISEIQVKELKEQVANLKKLDTDAFDKNIPLPLNVPEDYWKHMRNYNQLEVVKQLDIPIFVIQGERDYQVTMEDFEMWKSTLNQKKNASFKSYPKLNHLLHEGEEKSTPSEYSIKSSMPDYVIDDIANWILSF